MNDSTYNLPITARVRIWAAPLILQGKDYVHEFVADMPLLTRVASHVGMILLVVLTVGASGIQLDSRSENESVATDPVADNAPVMNDSSDGGGFLSRVPNPVTDVPKRVRREVQKYAVEPGDTVSDIADQFEISADSVLWANPKLEDNPDMLSVGQTLNIPPTTGVLYTIQNGDTLQKIADKFKGKRKADEVVKDILGSEFNQEHEELKGPDSPLTIGEFLMVPGS